MSALRVERLSKEFGGVRAIDDLSWQPRPGTIHSIIGPNGAGKTTLLNLLTGVYMPSTGRIIFGERDLTGAPPHEFAAAGIGRTFQNLQIFFNMTALENVMTGRHLRERCGLLTALLHTPRLARAEHECRARALYLLRFLGLESYAWIGAAGTTVVLVEHNMHLVMGVSDHILVLDYGRRLSEGTAAEVRADPRVIEAYLGTADSVEVGHA